MSDTKYALAMYDVRGIQDYIFRTAKIRDAIGASALVEHIIEDALEYACKEQGLAEADIELEWFDSNGPLDYVESEKMVQVLYVGLGACVCELTQERHRHYLFHFT